jgi:hypothetical protein
LEGETYAPDAAERQAPGRAPNAAHRNWVDRTQVVPLASAS